MISFRRMLLPLALATLGTALLHAYFTGQVKTLLHPMLHPLVCGSGFVLLFAAFAFVAFPSGDRSLWKSGRDLLLALTFLVALAAAPDSFSSLALANRANADPTAILRGKSASDAAETEAAYAWKPDNNGVIPLEVTDLFMAVGLPKSMEALEGKKVRLLGQTAPDKDNKEGFRLVRFLMFCCAADAQPVALAVEGARPAGLADMGWAEAVGTVHFRNVAPDKQEPTITLESAKAIPEPKDKFLY